MSCVLRASGKTFASREYAARTSLPVLKVYARGEPRFRSKPDGKKNQRSGVNISVSDADFTNLKRQIRDAIAFLARHKRALSRLRRSEGLEDLTLDFGVADRDVAAQFDYFPADLLLAAGRLGIGIEVSRYHAFGGTDGAGLDDGRCVPPSVPKKLG
jgi:hypothetical protein